MQSRDHNKVALTEQLRQPLRVPDLVDDSRERVAAEGLSERLVQVSLRGGDEPSIERGAELVREPAAAHAVNVGSHLIE